MTITELQPYAALVLGAIGTLLGIVNLIRDVQKNKESVEISAYPVIRTSIQQKNNVAAEFSKLEIMTTKNQFRNVALVSPEVLLEHIENGAVPNLIGFEVTNLSTKSIYIDNLGLANEKNKNIYRGGGLDAIQSLKAEMLESNGIEVKQNGKFTTFLFLETLASKNIAEGGFYPFIETTSKKRRFFSKSTTLEAFSKWLAKGKENV
jgi:hypothetical protein